MEEEKHKKDMPEKDNNKKPEKEKKKISEKQIKILVLVVLVVVIIGYLVWGMTPEKFYEASEILENPADFDGMEIDVKGLVGSWNMTSGFILLDSNNQNLTINVTHNSAFPEGFGNGETIVVTGVFTYSNGIGHIESESIQIGCPSKY